MPSVTRRQFIETVGLGLAAATLAGSPINRAAAEGETAQQGAQARQPRTWHVDVGAQSADMAIQGNAFLPTQLWINKGDTVVWHSTTPEIHTVTFLPPGQERPPFNPADPMQLQPQGGDHYDGKGYFNSGLIVEGQTYQLTFDAEGDFTYICLVHRMMVGFVHVRPAGTPYPLNEHDYHIQAELQKANILAHGNSLQLEAQIFAAARSSRDLHLVTAGRGDGAVALMRFYPQELTVHVGDTVTFVNLDVEAPHTVTFMSKEEEEAREEEGGVEAFFAPFGDPTNYRGSEPLNSGFLGTDPHWFGTTFRVTFAKAGTYPYLCAIHDDLGMVGSIVVHRRDGGG